MNKYFLLIIISSFCNCWAQIFLKKSSATSFNLNSEKFSFLLYLSIGIFLYGSSFLLTIFILRNIKVSVAFPINFAISFIFLSIFSYFLFDETFCLQKIFYIIIIIVGILGLSKYQYIT